MTPEMPPKPGIRQLIEETEVPFYVLDPEAWPGGVRIASVGHSYTPEWRAEPGWKLISLSVFYEPVDESAALTTSWRERDGGDLVDVDASSAIGQLMDSLHIEDLPHPYGDPDIQSDGGFPLGDDWGVTKAEMFHHTKRPVASITLRSIHGRPVALHLAVWEGNPQALLDGLVEIDRHLLDQAELPDSV